MKFFLFVICFLALVWRVCIATVIIYDRIKTGAPSPTLNVILWDSILVIVLAVSQLIKIWMSCM